MPKNYKYYDLILGAYVCVLLCANLIGPAKVSTIHVPLVGSVTFMAGVLFFPISYVFGDVLTEVYGYARDRRCVRRAESRILDQHVLGIELAEGIDLFGSDHRRSLSAFAPPVAASNSSTCGRSNSPGQGGSIMHRVMCRGRCERRPPSVGSSFPRTRAWRRDA